MNNRLYVGNLSYDTSEAALRSHFAGAGEITEVQVVSDRVTGQSRGFAFVTMASAQEAAKATAELNGSTLDGRALRVDQAQERPRRDVGRGRW